MKQIKRQILVLILVFILALSIVNPTNVHAYGDKIDYDNYKKILLYDSKSRDNIITRNAIKNYNLPKEIRESLDETLENLDKTNKDIRISLLVDKKNRSNDYSVEYNGYKNKKYKDYIIEINGSSENAKNVYFGRADSLLKKLYKILKKWIKVGILTESLKNEKVAYALTAVEIFKEIIPQGIPSSTEVKVTAKLFETKYDKWTYIKAEDFYGNEGWQFGARTQKSKFYFLLRSDFPGANNYGNEEMTLYTPIRTKNTKNYFNSDRKAYYSYIDGYVERIYNYKYLDKIFLSVVGN